MELKKGGLHIQSTRRTRSRAGYLDLQEQLEKDKQKKIESNKQFMNNIINKKNQKEKMSKLTDYVSQVNESKCIFIGINTNSILDLDNILK